MATNEPINDEKHAPAAESVAMTSNDEAASPAASASANADAASAKPDDATANRYPSGIALFFIVLALILSIFLASLDMVRVVGNKFPKE